VKDLER